MAKKRKDGGINSFIEKAESNFGEKIIYKKYKDNDKERMEREIEFLLEQEKNDLRNVPLLREKNREEGWIAMTYLEGDKVTEMNEKVAYAIIDFLKEINNNRMASKLNYAKDAYLSKYDLENDLKRREEIYKCSRREKVSIEFDRWVNDKLIKQSHKEINVIKKTNFWDIQRNGLIVSPSDIGPHNMIKKEDKYYFIDFEYAGLDNPNKTILDLICQPNHDIGKKLEDYLIKELGKLVLDKGIKWREDLQGMKKIFIIKWCFIMMNGIQEYNSKSEDEIKEYYSRACKLLY